MAISPKAQMQGNSRAGSREKFVQSKTGATGAGNNYSSTQVNRNQRVFIINNSSGDGGANGKQSDSSLKGSSEQVVSHKLQNHDLKSNGQSAP